MKKILLILVAVLFLAGIALSAPAACVLSSGLDSIVRSGNTLTVDVTGLSGSSIKVSDSQNRLSACSLSGSLATCPLNSLSINDSSFKVKVDCTTGSSAYFVTRYPPSVLNAVAVPELPVSFVFIVGLLVTGLLFFGRKDSLLK